MRFELVPWGEGDLPVLRRANTPAMTRYLGGPESDAALVQQHADYLELAQKGEGSMFRVDVDGVAAGYAGWWPEQHDGTPVYEVGCAIEPQWQGRGVATTVLREVVRRAAAAGDRSAMVGYAHADNAASNALCERCGFALTGTASFPPAGGVPGMPVNVWMIDLLAPAPDAAMPAPLAGGAGITGRAGE